MQIDHLYYYPIKALNGIAVHQMLYDGHGLIGDRQYILTRNDGHMITRRSHPTLVNFSITTHPDSIKVAINSDEISIRSDDFSSTIHELVVWKRAVRAKKAITEINDFFSDAMGENLTLYSYVPDTVDDAGFRDSKPLLVINVSSIRKLEEITGVSLDLRRFRPNIVTDTGTPFSEMHWSTIDINHQKFYIEKACARCVVINQNPATGSTDVNLLRVLSQLNLSAAALFGQYIAPTIHSGLLQISDSILNS